MLADRRYVSVTVEPVHRGVHRLIDPDTSYVLADEESIGNRSDPSVETLILGVGWTNEKPHKPAQ